MPFVPYQKPTDLYRRAQANEPTVKMWRGGNNGTTITLNNPLVENLKWIPGDRIQVMIGTDADEGIIAIQRAPDGFKLTRDGSKGRLKFATRGLFRSGPNVKATTCRYSIKNGVLYIEVPKAFTAPQSFNTTNAAFNINAMVAA